MFVCFIVSQIALVGAFEFFHTPQMQAGNVHGGNTNNEDEWRGVSNKPDEESVPKTGANSVPCIHMVLGDDKSDRDQESIFC